MTLYKSFHEIQLQLEFVFFPLKNVVRDQVSSCCPTCPRCPPTTQAEMATMLTATPARTTNCDCDSSGPLAKEDLPQTDSEPNFTAKERLG